MAAVRQRQTLRRPVVRLLEGELDFVLDVAARTLADASPGSACAPAHAPAEERREEIGEGIRIPKQFLHFFLRHRTEAAAASGATDVEAAGERSAAWLCAGLLVHPPVGAELVVLL